MDGGRGRGWVEGRVEDDDNDGEEDDEKEVEGGGGVVKASVYFGGGGFNCGKANKNQQKFDKSMKTTTCFEP